jgi:hypothetical protein
MTDQAGSVEDVAGVEEEAQQDTAVKEAPKITFNANGEPRVGQDRPSEKYKKSGKLKNDYYESELTRLQEELVRYNIGSRKKVCGSLSSSRDGTQPERAAQSSGLRNG